MFVHVVGVVCRTLVVEAAYLRSETLSCSTKVANRTTNWQKQLKGRGEARCMTTHRHTGLKQPIHVPSNSKRYCSRHFFSSRRCVLLILAFSSDPGSEEAAQPIFEGDRHELKTADSRSPTIQRKNDVTQAWDVAWDQKSSKVAAQEPENGVDAHSKNGMTLSRFQGKFDNMITSPIH